MISVAEDSCSEGTNALVAILTKSGSARLEPLLSQAQVADVLAFLECKKVIADGHSFRPTDAPEEVPLAEYSLHDVLSAPHLAPLMNDPTVLKIARAYLGCCPTISAVNLQWSFPATGKANDVQYFHRDPDDWRFLKLFIYLTEVNESTGPHEFVLGSHRSSGRVFSRPYSPEEIELTYGSENVAKIVGTEGTTFIEDTWGIHRGQAPIAGPRLLFQVQYSILPIMKFKYAPLPIPSLIGFDRYVNRLLIVPSESDKSQARSEA